MGAAGLSYALNLSKIAHYEALMRNADPAGHIIAARDFISVIR